MAKILRLNIAGMNVYKVANDFEIENVEVLGGELLDESPELLALCAAEPEVPSDPDTSTPEEE